MQTKHDVLDWLEENIHLFTQIADEIWATPEIAFQEFKSSMLQADFLEEEGFTITWDVGGMSTAFMAEWGQGKPVIGFAGEYDALPGLSQKSQATQEAIEEGGHGHGCGHNLLGTGCLAAAVALKQWLASTGQEGTVRYYGCPAEEQGSGKVFMARAGAFDDLDAAFNFHPDYINTASKGSCVGTNDIKFRFHGETAHAGMQPHLGRSALDAVELLNVGVNFLREHVPEKTRIHYVITDGGQAPNIVPDTAEVWYFVRAHMPEEVAELMARVQKIAQGAALMTETELEEIREAGSSCLLNNHTLADLQYEAMETIGPIPFTEEEIAFAQEINENYPEHVRVALAEEIKAFEVPEEVTSQPLIGGHFPPADEDRVMTGSTDVGDMSWKVPLSMLSTACWPTGAPVHSWGIVASGSMSIGHKGMMYAAKVMAISALELYTNPEKLQHVREEFEKETGKRAYHCPVPDGVHPPYYKHPLR